MGLKITKTIGTDQGISDEAYVRIDNYNINKRGNAEFNIQLFLKKEDSVYDGPQGMNIKDTNVYNAAVGRQFSIRLTKEVEDSRELTRLVVKEVEEETTRLEMVDGEQVQVPHIITSMKEVEEKYTETFTHTVPDLTVLEGTDIFTFAYSKLKTHLESIFGEGNVVDC